MVTTTYRKGKDQPDKLGCQFCSWSAEQGKYIVFLSSFAPENLVSRDGFGSPVPRQPAPLHTQAESSSGIYVDPRRQVVCESITERDRMALCGVQFFEVLN